MHERRVFEQFSLQGRCALITDLGTGPAQEVAPLLADAGASVLVANPNERIAASLAQAIGENGGEAEAVGCDLVTQSAVQALFAHADARLGRLDILVNCAAMTLNVPFLESHLSQLDEQYASNLRSPYLLMREAVRRMTAQGHGGRIVHISTMGAEHPVLHGNALYSSSRAALNMMCRNVALDHARDRVLVNVVLAGAFPGKVTLHADTQARVQQGHPLDGPVMAPGRMPLGFGDPWDIAAAVLFLVGPSGGFITGQSLTLDGGFLLS